jgi:cytidyltransferase-like protein
MKVTSLNDVITFSSKYRNESKTVGLIVGSFDILHMGHLNLFRLAKKHVDILIVGLDHDKTIKMTKGNNRPVNNYERRSSFLNDLHNVDKVFLIEEISIHGSEEALSTYTNLIEKLAPTHIFTHKRCDKHWNLKEKLAKQYGITFIIDNSEKITTSGDIIKRLELDF